MSSEYEIGKSIQDIYNKLELLYGKIQDIEKYILPNESEEDKSRWKRKT